MFDGERNDPAVAAALPDQPAADRRATRRHVAVLRVGKILTARGEDLCLVRNISAGGLMARLYTRVAVDEAVRVEIGAHRDMAGTVRWIRDDCAGIRFDAPVDVAAILSDRGPEGAYRPRAPRLSHACRATLRVGAHYHRVMVRDIGQGGVRIDAPEGLSAGAAVILTMEGFRAVAGTICWVRDGGAGIAFNQIVPYPELTGWLKARRPD